jgi:hypothetical protein
MFFLYQLILNEMNNKVNGNLNGHVEAADVCKVFHDFYSKLYKVDESVAGNIPVKLSNYYPNLNIPRFSIIDEISLDELQLAVSQIKSDKANGTDLISNNVLKMLPVSALSYILLLFNKIISTGLILRAGKTQAPSSCSKMEMLMKLATTVQFV